MINIDQQIAQDDLVVLEGATLGVPAAWPAFERLRDELERLRGIERHVQDMEKALDFIARRRIALEAFGLGNIADVADAALPAREKGTE